MAAYEGRPLVMEMEHEEDFNGLEEATSSGCGCGCGWFRIFISLKWWQGHEEEGKRLLEQKGEGGGDGWAMKNLKKMKETSEVIAGPKWKTFIRKISKKKQQKKRFQYDEQSYALNFSSGAQSEDDEDSYMRPTFSSRFSAPLPAGATSVRQNEL